MSDFTVVKKDQLLFEEGDMPDNMYIVRSGQFAIFIREGDVEKRSGVGRPRKPDRRNGVV